MVGSPGKVFVPSASLGSYAGNSLNATWSAVSQPATYVAANTVVGKSA